MAGGNLARSFPDPQGSSAPTDAAPQSSSDPDDDRAVRDTLLGNRDAFDRLVEKYKDRVFNLLLRMTGSQDTSDDLTQETFLKAFRGLGSFRQGSTFYTWLFRIAANTAFSWGRSKGRRQEHEGVSLDAGAPGEDGALRDSIPQPDAPAPGENLEREHVQKRVQEGLAQLSEDYRAILVLRIVEGLDYAQIGGVLKLSESAVKSRLHRARLELARKLKDLQSA